MKKFFLFIFAILIGLSAFSQPITPNPDNFYVYGVVKNSATGTPIPNKSVRVRALNGITFNQVVQTNLTGNYLVEIKNGSLIGQNINYEVSVFDCDSVLRADTARNMQGTVDFKNVNFSICQKLQSYCKAGYKFSISPINPLRVLLTNLSTGDSLTYAWYLSNGSTIFSNQANPEFTFPAAGTYEVCLKIFSGKNAKCTDTYCSKITVGANTSTCNAQFDFVNNTDKTISGKPTAPLNTGYTYVWGILFNGINQTVVGYNPVLPLGIGLNKVCLKVYGSGCDQLFCKEITIPAPPTTLICNAEFRFLDSLKAPATITFNSDPSQTSDKGYKHYWSFGDNTPMSDGTNPVHVYDKPGKYYVCHKVINMMANCEKSVCKIVTVFPKDTIVCQAYFSYKYSTIVPNRIIFQNLSLGASSATQFVWNFGDGSKEDSTFNAEHTYSGPGIYKVCLTLKNGLCSNTFCKEVKIEGPQTSICDAGFKFQDSLKAPANVVFYPKENTTSANGFIHYWSFGDNTFSNLEKPEHIYLKPGKYTVCHKIVNTQANCEKALCREITILPKDSSFCKAYFNNYFSTAIPNRVIFKNLSLGLTSKTEYKWTFGDGSNPDTTFNAEHTFQLPGTYTVCLQIKNGDCSDQFCKTILIGGSPTKCNADFKWTIPNPFAPFKVAFYSINSSNVNLLHKWRFTATGTSVLPNPVYGFPAPGKYKVCHYVYDKVTLCSDSICKEVIVGQPPVDSFSCKAKFIWYSSDANPLKVQFKNQSLGFTSTAWSFGDGTYSTDINPSHLYAKPGIYNVCLKIKSDKCEDTYCAQVNIQKDSSGFTIGGLVFAGSKRADIAKVQLIKKDPISNSLIVIATTLVDSVGHYTFTNVPSGIYLIRAALLPSSLYFNNYIPTYFGSQFYWVFAEPVVVNANGDSYNISLIYSKFKKGPGIFGGGVKGPHRLDESALSDVSIIVTGLDDEPQAWTITDENGNFKEVSLEYGTYRMWADIAGLECEPVEFTISPENPNVEFTLSLNGEATIIKNISNKSVFRTEVYPNPANDVVQFDVELTGNSSIYVQLTNLAGQTVYNALQNAGSGQQRLTIPVTEIPSGLYLIGIRDAESGALLGVKRLSIAH